MPPYPAAESVGTVRARELDQYAIGHWGYPSLILMENAGRNAAGVIYSLLDRPGEAFVLVLCGPGNNGGDGLVIARHLRNSGVRVQCVMAGERDKLSSDCATNLAIMERLGEVVLWVDVDTHAPAVFEKATCVVDALLGTGSRGAPRGAMARLVETANLRPRSVVRCAIDIPTGLDADSGQVHDPTFRADWTITLAAPKLGFAAAQAVCGRVVVVDIGAPVSEIPTGGA